VVADEFWEMGFTVAIVSFSKKFIFVKTAKTAGTSIEVFLSQYCSGADIVTPIFPANPSHVPCNFTSQGATTFYNHMPAVEIRQALEPEQFSTFFKFCFERHPIDKCLSHFAMLLNSPGHQAEGNPKTWEDYLERGVFPNNSPIYTDEGGNLLVDRIYKYEELAQSIKDVCAEIGVSGAELTVFEKAGFRHGVPEFATVMRNTAQKDRIMKAFESTLRFVDYVAAAK
jgi:hypothetical protein